MGGKRRFPFRDNAGWKRQIRQSGRKPALTPTSHAAAALTLTVTIHAAAESAETSMLQAAARPVPQPPPQRRAVPKTRAFHPRGGPWRVGPSEPGSAEFGWVGLGWGYRMDRGRSRGCGCRMDRGR